MSDFDNTKKMAELEDSLANKALREARAKEMLKEAIAEVRQQNLVASFRQQLADTQRKLEAALSTDAQPEVTGAVAWITDTLPVVPAGEDMHCFVASKGKKTGQIYVFDAYYVNKPVPENEDELDNAIDNNRVLIDYNGAPIPFVGWAEMTSHPDFNGYYEPLTFDNAEFLGWMPVVYPTYPLTANPPSAIQAAVMEKLEEIHRICEVEKAGYDEPPSGWDRTDPTHAEYFGYQQACDDIAERIRALMESPHSSVEEPAN